MQFRLPLRFGSYLVAVALIVLALWLEVNQPTRATLPQRQTPLITNSQKADKNSASKRAVDSKALPPEVSSTLQRIKAGGPFPFERDGIPFGNFEGRLPHKPRGYYREFTVPTPGRRDRGARRIVAGSQGELYYSDDHYQTFQRLEDQ